MRLSSAAPISSGVRWLSFSSRRAARYRSRMSIRATYPTSWRVPTDWAARPAPPAGTGEDGKSRAGAWCAADREREVEGKSVVDGGDVGGGRSFKNKKDN